jgi:hypothetical protein
VDGSRCANIDVEKGDPPGPQSVAVMLDLIDEIERLRAHLQRSGI